MFARGLSFFPNGGRRRRTSAGNKHRDEDPTAQQPLPVRDERGLTSSYATDHSSADAFIPAVALDPILGPDVSAIGRSSQRHANDMSLHSDCFDDVSSMNDDSMLFSGPVTTNDDNYSSPVQSLLDLQKEDPPEISRLMDVTETDIQTVNTEHVFGNHSSATLGAGATRKYAQLDIENAVHRILQVSDGEDDDNNNATEMDKVSPTHTKATTSGDDDDSAPPSPRSSDPGFLDWVREAPFWLKMLFAGSLFFLCLAFVLVVVGVYVATTANNKELDANSNNADVWFPDNFFPEDDGGSFPIVPRPTPPPVLATFPQVPVITLPKPPTEPFPPPIDLEPTVAPTSQPTEEPIPLQTTVYITSGILPVSNEVTNVLTGLPGTFENAFLVHLGDWNNATNIACDETVFQQTAAFYRQSSVPVYFAVGDNEYNDCPDPMTGLTNWKKYFLNFYKHWSNPPWQMSRQGDMSEEYAQFDENYLFVHNQAAFITLNLVSGFVHDEEEFALRIQANLDWIRLAYTFYKDAVETIVIFAHSNVLTGTQPNRDFFDALYEAIEEDYDGVRFILAHRGSGRWSLQQNYKGVENLDVINVPAGMLPPLKLVIRDGRPIALQANWMEL